MECKKQMFDHKWVYTTQFLSLNYKVSLVIENEF